jgi:hypothetical protein
MALLNVIAHKYLAVTLIIAIFIGGCATNKLYQFEEGPNGSKIYRTRDGDTLRVDPEGKVYGYPGNKRFGPGEHGMATRNGEEWEMSSFDVEPAPVGCKILFPVFYSDKAVKERYVSCWNRAWEIPAFVIALPVFIVGAVVMVSIEGIGALVEAVKE